MEGFRGRCRSRSTDDPDDPDYGGQLDYYLERGRQKRLLILKRRKIRDVADPFNVTYETFTKSYRLSQDAVKSLVQILGPYVMETTSPLALPLELKVLATLSFYATGSYQTPTGRPYYFAIAQPTVSSYIEEITNALNEDDILSRLICFPSDVREVNTCTERNRAVGGKISSVVGYTDGFLIKIMKPSIDENRQAFMGRKSFASMNALFTCDRRMYVMNVNPKFPGSTYDSFVFQGTSLRRRMMELYRLQRCHLLGDSGYALEPWMLTPFARGDRPQENSPENRYNKAHCSDRNAVERCIEDEVQSCK